MVLPASGVLGSLADLSSSCMPFLKALMPWATSPISSEILPRPNSSSRTAITTIQCQMLRPPIKFPPSRRLAAQAAWFADKLGAGAGKNKDFRGRLRATDWPARPRRRDILPPPPGGGRSPAAGRRGGGGPVLPHPAPPP